MAACHDTLGYGEEIVEIDVVKARRTAFEERWDEHSRHALADYVATHPHGGCGVKRGVYGAL